MQTIVEESFEQTLDELESTFVLPPETSEPAPVVDPETQQMQLYGITTAKIEALKGKCLELSCDDPRGYEDTRRMIALLRTTRTRIEKRRKEHNAEHQEAIRFVNGIAKQLTTFVENLEEPLKLKKLEVDEAKERAKRAAEAAEAERLAAIERARIEAEQAERRAAHEAEQTALREQAEQLAKERAEMEAARARAAEIQRTEDERLAKIRAEVATERARMEAERRAIDEAKAAAERAERDRLAKVQAETDAAAQAERDRAAALKRAEYLESIRPDVDKVRGYAAVVRSIIEKRPIVDSSEAAEALLAAVVQLRTLATDLENFATV